MTVSQSLRQEITQVLLRFSTVRPKFVATTVHSSLLDPGLSEFHHQFEIPGRVYASDA